MKNIYFPDFSCTHGCMCVYGRYAPALMIWLWYLTVNASYVSSTVEVVIMKTGNSLTFSGMHQREKLR